MKAPSSPLLVKSYTPWFGSEGAVVDQLVRQFGKPRKFWNMTFGGGASFLAMPRYRTETINDIHPGLINLLRVMNSPRGAKLSKLWDPITPCESLFDEAVAFRRENGYPIAPGVFEVKTIHVNAAFYLFIEWWAGVGGMIGTKASHNSPRLSRRFKDAAGGGRSNTRLRNAIKSVDALQARLYGVEIWHGDLFELVPQIGDDDETTIYLDVPWLVDGNVYLYPFTATEAREPSLLEPEGGRDRDDYDRLADLVEPFKRARVVIRLGAHERLNSLFTTGWTKVPITKNNNISNQSGGEGVTKDEVLIINGPEIG